MNEKATFKKSLEIGVSCISFYLCSYLFRQLLSVFTPQMLETGRFDKTMIAALSSAYMIAYALGNLLNGFIGDRVKPKYMVSTGLTVAGLALIFFPLAQVQALRLVLYTALGFGLSMLRGPLVKTISENMPEKHARVTCMFFSASLCLGPMLASLFVILFPWEPAFFIAGGLAFVAAVSCLISLSAMEKSGKIVILLAKTKEKRNLLAVFKLPRFTINLITDMMFEVLTIAVVFWAPTYMVQQLHFDDKVASVLYFIITAAAAVCPFLCLGCLKLFRDNYMAMMRGMFLLSAVLFIAMWFVPQPVVNVSLFLLAIMAVNTGCATIWSVFIPSLGPTGLVSSANGVFDCVGYISSGLANLLFAWVMERFDWSGTILTWALLGAVGGAITLLSKLPIFDKQSEI